ncbi:hypothetical protein FB451DRAFT_1161211 [Mycena latifolia]|nr:hypothetical protein FB451DRAFT_1161211 [Mycena latifolia]
MNHIQQLEIEHRIVQRETLLRCNVVKPETAILPIVPPSTGPYIPDSHISFIVCQTLRSLAMADTETLWDIYGSIMSKWPGSRQTSVESCVADERAWVAKFRQDGPPDDLEFRVRRAIADVEVQFIPTSQLKARADAWGKTVDELSDVVALHYRHESAKSILFILPFLPRVEQWILGQVLSPGVGLLPGQDLDALLVSTAKTVVHETRRIIATLLHGVAYTTPCLVQGSFAPPLSPAIHDEIPMEGGPWGEGGDWYEVSRYGAYTCPGLIAPTEEPTSFDNVAVAISGHLDETGPPRRLGFPQVGILAHLARTGRFVSDARRFFSAETTVRYKGYSVNMDTLDKIFTPAWQAVTPPQQQTLLRLSSRPSPRPQPPTSSDGTAPQLRSFSVRGRMGYPNHPGVLRVRILKCWSPVRIISDLRLQ